MLILSQKDVEALLPMAECITAVEEAMRALARGEYFQPLRMKAVPQNVANRMVLMPALRFVGTKMWCLKEIVVTPDNTTNRGLDSHQGAVLLHDGETGELLAAVHAGAITAIRTAAASAVATRALARKDAKTVTVLGTGVQGRAHLAAMRCVFPNSVLRVWSRTPSNAENVARATGAAIVETIEAGCRDADVICTVTAARDPILTAEMIPPGCHINAVGSSIAATRELDATLIAKASLFVDRRESTLNESGDYLFAAGEKGLGPEHIRAEIGDVLLGRHQGRSSDMEVTVYKSLGIAVQDLAAAELAFRKAQATGRGIAVDF
jgi:ornithine cyclodeaminase/alanine dehydrogenase-like protein (mu-crystallin family)